MLPELDFSERPHSALTEAIIGAAIEVHRELGPGLLESTYEECLAFELGLRGIPFLRQEPVLVTYKGHQIEAGFRIDLLVDEKVIVELKAVDRFIPVHEAQLLTYLKLTGCQVGLLMNFNVRLMKDGIKRLIL